MSGITAFIFHNDYLKYDFGVGHPLKIVREKYTLDLLQELEIFNGKAKLYVAEPATEDELMLIHTKEYINFVKKKSEEGTGYLDYGDTPATKGCFEVASIRVGGSLYGAELIMDGKVDHAFNPGGGFHHARESNAAGFCIFNDVALTVRLLQKKYGVKRIAVVDIDGHHADGTQSILYREPILKISLHRYDGFFYPGTGSLEEYGEGEGKGYNVNIPLPVG
ncbi:MAG: acetoin utilization protein AcuC, partial [Candidatus Bathyarchaeia archaeon]